MRWQQIDKGASQAPVTGTYSDWKPFLAKEAKWRCVYCCIHEVNFGGFRNFHVEHYRPQSKFPELKNTYSNLFYACGVCNVFKSNDWPGDIPTGEYSRIGYPDPSSVNYGQFLKINQFTGLATSESVTGKYVIERLHLNRPHLICLRVWSELLDRLRQINLELDQIVTGGINSSESEKIFEVLFQINSLMIKLQSTRPYAPDQLK